MAKIQIMQLFSLIRAVLFYVENSMRLIEIENKTSMMYLKHFHHHLVIKTLKPMQHLQPVL